MALTDAELIRCKQETGYNLLEIGAIPYIGITPIFEQIIQPYLNEGAATTSSTVVTAASSPTGVTLTLASATGFSAFDPVVIDVDDAEEQVTVRALSGASMSVLLTKAHSGTYPVLVYSGVTAVRVLLRRIEATKREMAEVFGTGSLKAVDEVQFYQGGRTQFGNLGNELAYWRDELCALLGIEGLWAQRRAGAQRLSVY